MKSLLGIIVVFYANLLCAQENLQTYTPSQLINENDWELKSFQNAYTQRKVFGSNSFSKQALSAGRQSYLTSINQFSYGLNSHINVGVDLWIKQVRYQDNTLRPRTAITGFGPRIKLAPFDNWNQFSIQSAILFPLEASLEAPYTKRGGPYPFLESDKVLWITQAYYDYKISGSWQLFMQQAFWYNFVRDSFRANNFLQTQTSFFLSYFPDQNWTFYLMSEYFPTHYNDQKQHFELFHQYFIQSGLGIKYQLIANVLEIEGLYTNFWAGSEGQGAGQTFNIGLRYIH